MKLTKEDFLLNFNTFSFRVYIDNLDCRVDTKAKITRIYNDTVDILNKEEIYSIVAKIVKKYP